MEGIVRKTRARAALAVAALLAGVAGRAEAGGLGGSPASMRHQHGVAVEEDYSFLRTGAQVRALAEDGKLVPVASNADFALSDVSYPYARPEVLTFLRRLASQYRAATGERLVVTSLVRPRAEQPSNASPLSVHPAGMAVDLRVPAAAASRKWLEDALLSLESAGVLDVTRERRPPHYHVAVFPAPYMAYVAQRVAADSARAAQEAKVAARPAPVVAPAPIAIAAAAAPVDTAPASGFGAWVGMLLVALLGAGAAARYRVAPVA
jgi:hypothetical protein